MTFKIERWASSTHKNEEHFFFEEDGKEIYLFGWNPDVIPPLTKKAILTALGMLFEKGELNENDKRSD